MRALTFAPGEKGTLEVREVPDPAPGTGELLVQGLALGICGTDREPAAAVYGWPPPGKARMVIGHESLGRVSEAPAGSAFSPGDRVAGVVRRPDPVPCEVETRVGRALLAGDVPAGSTIVVGAEKCELNVTVYAPEG